MITFYGSEQEASYLDIREEISNFFPPDITTSVEEINFGTRSHRMVDSVKFNIENRGGPFSGQLTIDPLSHPQFKARFIVKPNFPIQVKVEFLEAPNPMEDGYQSDELVIHAGERTIQVKLSVTLNWYATWPDPDAYNNPYFRPEHQITFRLKPEERRSFSNKLSFLLYKTEKMPPLLRIPAQGVLGIALFLTALLNDE